MKGSIPATSCCSARSRSCRTKPVDHCTIVWRKLRRRHCSNLATARGRKRAAHSAGNALATYAPKLTREDGRIDWSESAEAIERKIRAFNPWPGAFMKFDRQKSKDLFARQLSTQGQARRNFAQRQRTGRCHRQRRACARRSATGRQTSNERRGIFARACALIAERLIDHTLVGRVTPCAPWNRNGRREEDCPLYRLRYVVDPRILLSKRWHLLFHFIRRHENRSTRLQTHRAQIER